MAYLNVPSSAGGSRFSIASSTSLAHALIGVAKDVPHPTEVNRTLWDARYDIGPFVGRTGEGDDEGRKEHYHRVENLGAGDDYTVFLHHLGVNEQLIFLQFTPMLIAVIIRSQAPADRSNNL